MAQLEERIWEGSFAGPTRRGRRPCRYSVYLPDRLAGRWFSLDGDVAADVADAEANLVRLNTVATALANTEALARLLLRAESVASSRMRVWWWAEGGFCAPTQRVSWECRSGTLRPPKFWPTLTPCSGEWRR